MATSSNPPLGYITLERAESRHDTFDHQTGDKIATISKSAVHGYIKSFFDPNGANRGFTKAFASPHGLQFETSLSLDDEGKSDPGKRKLQISRFLAENTARLPSILIADQGMEYVDTGVNEIIGASSIGGSWQGELLVMAKVSVSIIVATLSEEDTDTLSSLLISIVGPLAAITNGYIIKERGKRWEVRLPLSGITIGQNTNIAIEGDVKTQVWTRAVDITVDFESVIGIEQPQLDLVIPYEPVIGITKEGHPLPIFLNFVPNQALVLGATYQLFIKYLRPTQTLRISDPNIALITDEPPWLIQPRRVGKALLLMYNTSLPTYHTPEEAFRASNLILDIPFRIVLPST